MMRFTSLLALSPGLSVGKQQLEAAARLPGLVRDSALHWWEPGDPITPHGTRLLVGVATYSRLDMELLDALESHLRQENGLAPRIDVFSTLSCQSHKDFENYVPGSGMIFQTPVVGVWRDGVLQESAQGYYGRALVWKTLGRNPVVAAS